jgi:predicted nucleic acid-binding protein
MAPERIFADTNLFLRYLTNDVPTQADAFEKLLIDASQGKIQLVTSPLVIAEIVWTLKSYYRLTKSEVRSKLSQF